MPKRTINEAIIEAFKREGKSLRVTELYSRIKEDDLYRFNASDPEHIIRTQLRRHSANLSFPTAHKAKHFVFLDDGKYTLKDNLTEKELSKAESDEDLEETIIQDLRALHLKHLNDFKAELLGDILKLKPFAFEAFCKKLLEVYGFKQVQVTKKTRDGGIDGFGELKIGFADFHVAFECKRYTGTSVNHKIVNEFRGAISGKYTQGILFTTSDFTKGAKEVSFRIGAVPIVLIDGESIVQIMIDKEMGVEKKFLPIYSNALDLVLD